MATITPTRRRTAYQIGEFVVCPIKQNPFNGRKWLRLYEVRHCDGTDRGRHATIDSAVREAHRLHLKSLTGGA